MADTAMLETTPTPETEKDEREYLAMLPNSWGRCKYNEDTALINAVKAFHDNGLYRMMKKDAKSLPFVIYEVTGDWKISDFNGSVTAKTIKDVAKGDVPLSLAKTIWDAFDAVEDLITSVRED